MIEIVFDKLINALTKAAHLPPQERNTNHSLLDKIGDTRFVLIFVLIGEATHEINNWRVT